MAREVVRRRGPFVGTDSDDTTALLPRGTSTRQPGHLRRQPGHSRRCLTAQETSPASPQPDLGRETTRDPHVRCLPEPQDRDPIDHDPPRSAVPHDLRAGCGAGQDHGGSHAVANEADAEHGGWSKVLVAVRCGFLGELLNCLRQSGHSVRRDGVVAAGETIQPDLSGTCPSGRSDLNGLDAGESRSLSREHDGNPTHDVNA